MSELLTRVALATTSLFMLSFLANPVRAEKENQEPPPAASPAADAQGDAPSIQLNKLETAEKGCRAYLVVNNPSSKTYQSYKVDLVLFQTDGVIGRRFSIELAPLKPQKKTVKLFEIDNIACDAIGSLLVNDVMECKTDAGPVDNCLQALTTTSLGKVQLSK